MWIVTETPPQYKVNHHADVLDFCIMDSDDGDVHDFYATLEDAELAYLKEHGVTWESVEAEWLAQSQDVASAPYVVIANLPVNDPEQDKRWHRLFGLDNTEFVNDRV